MLSCFKINYESFHNVTMSQIKTHTHTHTQEMIQFGIPESAPGIALRKVSDVYLWYPYSLARTFRLLDGYAKTVVNNSKYLGNKNKQIPPNKGRREIVTTWTGSYTDKACRGRAGERRSQRKTSMLLPKTKQENSCLICWSFSKVKFFISKSQLSSLTI